MEKIVFSYTLFEPKELFIDRRQHDVHHQSKLRYWYNLPLIPIINQTLFPGSETWLYLGASLISHPLFEMINVLRDRFSSFKVIIKNEDYKTIEPTFYRFEPIFNADLDVVFTRDIDSICSTEEYLLTKYFIERKDVYLSTIRSHPNHRFPITIILAGLSGFKPKKLLELKPMEYNKFFSIYSSEEYGSDQKSLISFFTDDADFTMRYFLDCRIEKAVKIAEPLIPCKKLKYNRKHFNLNTNPKIQELMGWLDCAMLWSGEPIDVRGVLLDRFLSLKLDGMDELIHALSSCSKPIKDFYFFKKESAFN